MFAQKITPPAIVALLFLGFGAAWILGTDYLLERYAGSNHQVLVTIGKVKGSAFVGAAALLLYQVTRYFHLKYCISLTKANNLAQRYQGLYQAIADGVIEYDYGTDTCQVNAYLQEQMNFPSGAIANAGQRQLDAIHPND